MEWRLGHTSMTVQHAMEYLTMYGVETGNRADDEAVR